MEHLTSPSKAIRRLLLSSILSVGALVVLAAPGFSHAATSPALVVSPTDIIQGDPIMVAVDGAAGNASTTRIYFDGKPLKVFLYKNRPTALYGFDIHKAAGVYIVSAKLPNGTTLKQNVLVGERKKEEVVFSIPAKLGGNTTSSQKTLSSTLAEENASLVGLKTAATAYWTKKFMLPLDNAVVTDSYGYSRATGATILTHKGTDFHAAEGTPVMAINRGVVRLVQQTRNYGKTVIVDHGLGLMSLYMHLSKIYVNTGDIVGQGQYVGLSGQTGYAEAPHLHLTVRINDISVDPMRFFGLFP